MARPSKHDGVVYRRTGTQFWWMRYRDRAGTRREESTGTEDWKEAQQETARAPPGAGRQRPGDRPQGRAAHVRAVGGVFLENYSKPPLRSQRRTRCNSARSCTSEGVRDQQSGRALDAMRSKAYLRHRLRQRVKRKTRAGFVERGVLKPSTVHQELRVLRRMLNVAVARSCCRQSVLGRGVSRRGEGAVPAALHGVVGAAADRVGGAALPAQRRSGSSRRPDFGSTRNWRR